MPTPTPKTARALGAARRVRLPYVPGLDGLRALAVIAVLVYHADVAWLPGGFLGVEVFFVLSGYLITSLLLAEWRGTATLDLRSFWARRARRLLPALYALIALTLAVAVFALPGQVARLRADAAAALLYVTNWYLIFHHQSYFVAIGRPSLLQHLWSLAVEEQFYLVWPPVLWLGLRLCGRRFGALALVAALASSVEMALLFRPGVDPSRLYYGADTRAAGLLLGSALAFAWSPDDPPALPGWLPARLLDGAGALGLAALTVLCLWLGEYSATLYRGGFLLVGLATAALIAVVSHPAARWARAAAGWAPLRWLGVRSYGIYLWHWPVFMLTRPGLDVPLSGLLLLALRCGVTVALAALSYRFIETPVRGGALGRAWQAVRSGEFPRRQPQQLVPAVAGGVVAGSAAVLLGAVAVAQNPAPPPQLSVTALRIPLSAARSDTAPPTSLTVTPPPTIDPASTPAAPAAAATAAAAAPSATPAPTPPPLETDRVVAVGDSVMLGASPVLEATIPALEIDAEVSRQITAETDVLRAVAAAGELTDIVVVQVGDNGPISQAQLDDLMDAVACARHVIVINAKVPLDWEGPNDALLASELKRFPNAELLDWRRAASGHPEYFLDDGVHLVEPGMRFYAQLIAQRLAAYGVAVAPDVLPPPESPRAQAAH